MYLQIWNVYPYLLFLFPPLPPTNPTSQEFICIHWWSFHKQTPFQGRSDKREENSLHQGTFALPSIPTTLISFPGFYHLAMRRDSVHGWEGVPEFFENLTTLLFQLFHQQKVSMDRAQLLLAVFLSINFCAYAQQQQQQQQHTGMIASA